MTKQTTSFSRPKMKNISVTKADRADSKLALKFGYRAHDSIFSGRIAATHHFNLGGRRVHLIKS